MTTQARFLPLKKLRGTVAVLRRTPQGGWRYWDTFWRWFFVLTFVMPLLGGILAPSSSYGQSWRERVAQIIGLSTRLSIRYPLKWFFDWFLVDPCQTPWQLSRERIFTAENFLLGGYQLLRFIFGLPSRFIKFVAYTSLLRSIIIPYVIEPLFVKSYFSRWKENYYKYCDKHVLGWIPGMAVSALALVGAVISLAPRFLYYFLVRPLTTPWQELRNDAVGVGGKLAFAIGHVVKFAIVWPVEYLLLKPLFSSMRESWNDESGYTLLLMTEEEAKKEKIFGKRSICAKPVLIINPKTKKAYLFAYDGEKWVQLEPFDCENAPDVIKQGWKKNKRQVTITTQADRDFIEGDESNLIKAFKHNNWRWWTLAVIKQLAGLPLRIALIKVFEHNNWRWWTLAVIKQLAGLPLRIAVRWPLLALEYVLTGSTDLWPWQEEVEKSRKQRSKKRVVTRRLADCILYTGAFFFIGWPIILVRAVLKGIFITPFSHYQILKSEREPLNFLQHYLNPVRGVVYLIWRFSWGSEEFAESCLEMKVKLFSYTLGAIKVFTSAGMYWLLASLVLAHFFPPVAVLYIGCGIFALANGYVAKKTRFRSILAKVYLLFEPTTNAREIEIQIHFKVMMRRGIFVSAIFASVAAGFSGYLGGYSLIVVFGLVGLSGPFAPIALGVLLFLFAAASVTAYLCFQAATAYDNFEKLSYEVTLFTIIQLAVEPSADHSADFSFYVDDCNRLKCRFICTETQRIVIKTVSRRDLTPHSKELSDDDFNDMKEIVKGGGQIGRKYIYPYVQKQPRHYGIDDNSPSVQFSKMALPRESQVQIYVTGGVSDGDGGDQQLKCRFTNYKQDFATDGGMTDDQTNSRVGNKNKIIEKTISKDDLQISQKEFNKLLSDLKNNKPISAEMRSCIETHLTELSNGPEINCERNVSFASLFLALFISTAAISFFKTKRALLDSLGNGFGRVGLLALIVMSPDTVIKALTQVLKTSQAIEDNRKILEELESIFKILSSRNPFTILKFFLTGLDATGDFIIVMLTMPPILIAALGVGIPCRLFLAFAIAVKNAIWSLAMSAVFTGKKVCAALSEDSDEEMIQSLPKLYRQQCPCVFYNPATGGVYYYGERKKTVWRRITDFFKLREKTDVRKRELRLKTKRAIQNHLKENQGELKGVENIKKVSDMRICIYITSNDNDFLGDDNDFPERGDFREADGNLDNIIYAAIANEENNRVSIGFSYNGALGKSSKDSWREPLMDNDSVSNDKQRERPFPKSIVIHNDNESQSLLYCENENKTVRHNSEGLKRNGSKSASPFSCEEGEPDIMDCVHSQKSGQADFNFTENGWIDLCLAKAGIKEFATLSDEQAGLVALLIWVGYVYGVKKADTDFDGFAMVFNIHKILDAINPKSTSIENNLISQNTNYGSILTDKLVAKVGKKIRSNNSFSLGKKVSDSYGDFKCSWFRRRDRQSVKEMTDSIQDTEEAPQAFARFFKTHDLQKRDCRFEADDNNHEKYLSHVNYVNVMD